MLAYLQISSIGNCVTYDFIIVQLIYLLLVSFET